MITIAQGDCTGCEVCISVCDERAITSQKEIGRLFIAIDHSKCNLCGKCQLLCPEQALKIDNVTDTLEGLETLFECDLVQCDTCGHYFAPRPLIDKLQPIFSQRYPRALVSLRQCPACRSRSYDGIW